jgi:adenosylcobinamide kinase / adenosylcobinamide-phosphate guanylyltransferase
VRTLVLGGIRSGKSRWAEAAIAEPLAPDQVVHYLATGEAVNADATWWRRIAEHRDRRPPHWLTVETDDIATQLRQSQGTPTLIDDMGGWLTAVMDRRRAWEEGSVSVDVDVDVDDMLAAVAEFCSPLVLVSPEVGLTVVPTTESGRRFADERGMLNQRLAVLCDRVVLVIAGHPLPIKPAAIQ